MLTLGPVSASEQFPRSFRRTAANPLLNLGALIPLQGPQEAPAEVARDCEVEAQSEPPLPRVSANAVDAGDRVRQPAAQSDDSTCRFGGGHNTTGCGHGYPSKALPTT